MWVFPGIEIASFPVYLSVRPPFSVLFGRVVTPEWESFQWIFHIIHASSYRLS